MATYRRVPSLVHAFLYGVDDWPDWFIELVHAGKVEIHEPSSSKRDMDYLVIDGGNGKIRVAQGWYILRWTSNGRLHAYKPKVFNEIFEPVGEVV